MFRGSLFLKTLTNALVCVALVAGCDSSRKKDLEAQQSQYASQTAKAKDEALKTQELNRQLEALNAEAETIRTQLKEDKRTFSNQRSERERQLEGILLEIRDAAARLHQLQTNLTNIQSQIAAQEAVLIEQRDRMAQMRADTEEAIRKLRQNLANDEQKSREEIAAAEAELKARQETLARDIAEHQASEQALQIALASLHTAQDNLKASQDQLAQNQADLATRERAFADSVAAAREFFTRAGQGDVFDTIQNDQTFAFRVSLWGMGSAEKINEIRQRLINFNQSTGVRGDNVHRELSPALTLPLSNANKNRIMNVDDSFIVTTSATQMKSLRDAVNASLAQVSRPNVMSANMWLIARPIKQVRVNLKLSMYGSSDIGFDREQTLIMEFNKVRPLSTAIQGFQNIDITNPGQYIFRSGNSAACDRVTADCIKTLKSLGLLDQQSRFVLTNENGSAEAFTGSYAEYLSKLVDVSMTKLHLEDRVKQMMTDGLEITITRRVRPVERWSLWSGTYTDFEVIEDMDDSSIDDFLKQQDTLENLASQRILEKISISYEISMVDVIDGSRDSLDMNKFFFGSGTVEGAELQSIDLQNRGEVEIKLPVNLKNIRTSESNFANLTLSDFAPIAAPVALTAAEQQSANSLNGRNKRQIDNTFRQQGDVQAIINVLSGDQKTAASNYLKQLQYTVAFEAYNTQILPARENEYSRRRMILFGELNNLKEALQ